MSSLGPSWAVSHRLAGSTTRHLFPLNEEDSEKDALKERRTRRSGNWLTPIDLIGERDYVWSGYIDVRPRDDPLAQFVTGVIERQVGNFHSNRTNSPQNRTLLPIGLKLFSGFLSWRRPLGSIFVCPPEALHQNAVSAKRGTSLERDGRLSLLCPTERYGTAKTSRGKRCKSQR